MEAIERALSNYGASLPQVIYFKLEKDYHLNKENIPDEPKLFVQCVQEIFGEPSKKILEAVAGSIDKTFNLPKSDSVPRAIRNAKIALDEQ